MRQWPDVPLMALAKLTGQNIIFDRSLISVLAYNLNNDIYKKLAPFINDYSKDVHFIFNTYMDLKVIIDRDVAIVGEQIEQDDKNFHEIYRRLNIKHKNV